MSFTLRRTRTDDNVQVQYIFFRTLVYCEQTSALWASPTSRAGRPTLPLEGALVNNSGVQTISAADKTLDI